MNFAFDRGWCSMLNRCELCWIVLGCVLWPVAASAHPVPRENHDRKITVRLGSDAAAGDIRVRVHYVLEVDEYTVVADDMPKLLDGSEFKKLGSDRSKIFDEYVRLYAPILAKGLVASANGEPLTFRCAKKSYTFTDEDGRKLGHMRCEFLFDSHFTPIEGKNRFVFQEKNFETQTGEIAVWLMVDPAPAGPLHLFGQIAGAIVQASNGDPALPILHVLVASRVASILYPSLTLLSKTEAGEKYRQTPNIERPFDYDRKVRSASAVFQAQAAPIAVVTENTNDAQPQKNDTHQHHHGRSLLHLFASSENGFWLLMILSLAIGAAHALTPGHGKTLVAAYLVGERGTVWHAVVLGLVTTITHTGIVLILAVVLQFLPHSAKHIVQQFLALVLGAVITMLGGWLLYRRLAGKVDHIHIGGGHHHDHDHSHDHSHSHSHDHHHHDHSHEHGHDHHHHEHDHSHDHSHSHSHDHHHHEPVNAQPGWKALIILGMSGGIIPCWDAIAMLVLAIGMNLFWLALPMLLAFSAGLAGVLVLIGVLVVKMRSFAESRMGQGTIVKMLPIFSAVFITLMGLWLVYEGIVTGGAH